MKYIRLFPSASIRDAVLAEIEHGVLSYTEGEGVSIFAYKTTNPCVTLEFDVPAQSSGDTGLYTIPLYWYDPEFDPSDPDWSGPYYNPFSTMRINGGPEIEADTSVDLEPGHYVVELMMTHPTELRPFVFDEPYPDGTIITIPGSVSKVYPQHFECDTGDRNMVVRFTSQTLPELVSIEEDGEVYHIFTGKDTNLFIELTGSAYNAYSTTEYWEDLEDKGINIKRIHSIDEYDLTEPFYCVNTGEVDMNVLIYQYAWQEAHDTIQIEYSWDGSNWSSMGTLSYENSELYSPTVTPGQKLYLRANTPSWADTTTGEQTFINMVVHSQDVDDVQYFKVGGNIMSLIYGSNFTGQETSFPSGSSHNFNGLFRGNVGWEYKVDISELLLPATVLTEGCYEYLWHDYNGWRGSEPELYYSLPLFAKATVLADLCYDLNIPNRNYGINTREFNRRYIDNSLYDETIHGALVYTPQE